MNCNTENDKCFDPEAWTRFSQFLLPPQEIDSIPSQFKSNLFDNIRNHQHFDAVELVGMLSKAIQFKLEIFISETKCNSKGLLIF